MSFPNGATVILSGFASRPELNGVIGRVVGAGPRAERAAAVGRVCVLVEAEHIAVLPERLTRVGAQPGPATIKYEAKLNGRVEKETVVWSIGPVESPPTTPDAQAAFLRAHVFPRYALLAPRFHCCECGTAPAVGFVSNLLSYLHLPKDPSLVDFAFAFCASAACEDKCRLQSEAMMRNAAAAKGTPASRVHSSRIGM